MQYTVLKKIGETGLNRKPGVIISHLKYHIERIFLILVFIN